MGYKEKDFYYDCAIPKRNMRIGGAKMMDNISIDLTHNTIENLFFRQLKMLSITPRKAKIKNILSEESSDSDLYSDFGIEDSIDSDEITGREEGFMKGYINA